MRANIQFLQTNNKPLIFKQFLDIAQGIEQLWQSIMKQGILLEKLETDEIDALTQILAKLNYPDPKITKGTLRIQIADNTPVSLLSLIGVFSNTKNAFEEILWKRGFILENLTPDQAINLQSQLGKIAFATIAPDITPEPESLVNKVSGKISWSDNTPFTESGYVVHAFDENPPGKLASLASVKPIPSDGSYQITYTWQPEGGRNGPNLVVQLLDLQNKKVAESHQRFAGMEEILDLIVKKTQPNAYILTGIVKNQVTGAVLPNLRIEAQFRANSAALLTLTGITDTKGVVNIPFDASIFGKPPVNQQVEVIFMVSQDGQSLSTSTTIKSLQPGDQKVEIFVTIPESTNEKFIVKGTIRKADGSPLSGVVVRAFDRDLRKKELLGEQDTNVQGFFEIGYTRAQFSRMEKD